jgi:hypothetical protein
MKPAPTSNWPITAFSREAKRRSQARTNSLQSREIVGVRFDWRRVFRHGAGLPCVFAVSGVSAQGTS